MRTLRYRLDVTATADGDQRLAPLFGEALAKFAADGASHPGDQFTVKGEAGTQCTVTVEGYYQKWDFSDPAYFEEDGQTW